MGARTGGGGAKMHRNCSASAPRAQGADGAGALGARSASGTFSRPDGSGAAPGTSAGLAPLRYDRSRAPQGAPDGRQLLEHKGIERYE